MSKKIDQHIRSVVVDKFGAASDITAPVLHVVGTVERHVLATHETTMQNMITLGIYVLGQKKFSAFTKQHF
jgi:hypothetical protein